MKYADLHVHTFYSDSTFSPEEVVRLAVEKGLAAIAICDHDSVDGIAPCKAASSGCSIEIIPSVEMTIENIDVEIHILGYFIDWESGWFTEKLKEIRDSRVNRIYEMAKRLKDKGIDVDPDDVFKLAGKGTVGRLHMAQAMLKTGKVKNFKEAFDKYIGYSKPCYVPYTKFSPPEAIKSLLEAGGVPVLAHPATMGKDDYIPELVNWGLRGIEAYHVDHDADTMKHYRSLAEKYDLLVTGGSDCHGLGKGRVLLGTVRVPYELVEKLRAEAERIKGRRT